MKEFTTVSGLWVALSEFTQEETDLSDLSRLLQNPLHSQGQCQSFVSSNKRSYSRRRALFKLPDYLVVHWKWKKPLNLCTRCTWTLNTSGLTYVNYYLNSSRPILKVNLRVWNVATRICISVYCKATAKRFCIFLSIEILLWCSVSIQLSLRFCMRLCKNYVVLVAFYFSFSLHTSHY